MPPSGRAPAGERATARRETWPDVVTQGLLDQLVPWGARESASRLLWVSVILGIVAWLAPPDSRLGTDVVEHRYAIVGGFAALAAAAWWTRRAVGSPHLATTVSVALALVAIWAGGAQWAAAVPLFVVATLHGSRLRRRRPRPLHARESDPRPPVHGGLPLLLSRVASTLVIVLILREFVLETRNVPTGSMQPTIMGNRLPNAVGDHVLLDRAAYLVGEPARFQIAVFRYPLMPEVTFVKRIVGLPGETIDLRDGDVYVDGVLADKPERVQESLWQIQFPTGSRRKIVGNWDGSEDDGWRIEDDTPVVRPKRQEGSFLTFKKSIAAADVRVEADVEPRGEAGAVLLEVESRGLTVALRVPFGVGGEGALSVGDAAPLPLAVRLSGPARVRLAVVEGHVRVDVDRRRVLDAAMDTSGSGRSRVRVGAAGGEVRFAALRLETDLVYVTRNVRTHFEVPPGSYVMLGDNSAGSEDSRIWTATEFDVEGLSAPVRAALSAPDPSTGAPRANVTTKDGVTSLIDVHGIARSFPAKSVVARRAVPLPYVPRGHLLGRATAILWPWTRYDAGFRPRILP